jgi:hypothetical protein
MVIEHSPYQLTIDAEDPGKTGSHYEGQVSNVSPDRIGYSIITST